MNWDTFKNLLINKWYNLASLFHGNPHPSIPKTWNFYRNTLLGALNLTYVPLVIISILKNFRHQKLALLLFVAAPIISYIFIFLGFYNDLGLMLYLEGAVPFLLAMMAQLLLNSRYKFWAWLGLVIGLAEHAYVSWIKNFYIPFPEVKGFWKLSGQNFQIAVICFTVWYGLMIISATWLLWKPHFNSEKFNTK